MFKEQAMQALNIQDHYWKVLDQKEAIYSSKEKGYVGNTSESFQAWTKAGGLVTPIQSEDDLRDVLAKEYPEAWPADYLKAQAKEQLAKNDAVYVRCGKEGTEYNAEWQAYDEALRAIVKGTSELTELPEAPAYPS